MIEGRSRPLWSCAREELTLAVRSRMLVIFAVVFAGLAMLVAFSGYVLTGGTGMQDFSRTAASLVELILLVVPLASIIIGVTALTPEPGAAELLYAQPVARHRILLGKVAGLFLAMVAAEAIGFGASGLVVFSRTGDDGVARFAGVISASIVLTAIFLSAAAAVTAGATSRQRARILSTALVIWFGAVVLFDVAVLGAASWLPSGLGSRLMIVSAIVNPVDAVRTATLMAIEGTTAFGAASLAFLRFTNGASGAIWMLTASAVFWILTPLVVAAIRISRRDI